jgi:hypothetical protein
MKELELEMTPVRLSGSSLTRLQEKLPPEVFTKLKNLEQYEYPKGEFITRLMQTFDDDENTANRYIPIILNYTENMLATKQEHTPLKFLNHRYKTIEFIHRMSARIAKATLGFVNQRRIYELNNKVTTIKSSGNVFISDRSLKILAKMVVAHACLTGKTLEPTPNGDNIHFVLTKTWEDEEQIDEIEQLCGQYIY